MIVQRAEIDGTEFEGLRVFDYTAGANTSSSLARIEVPPGVTHPPAKSERSDKYYYVMSGTISFTLAGTEHRLQKGDFCLVQQGESFTYTNTTEQRVTLLLLHTPRFELEDEVFLD